MHSKLVNINSYLQINLDLKFKEFVVCDMWNFTQEYENLRKVVKIEYFVDEK